MGTYPAVQVTVRYHVITLPLLQMHVVSSTQEVNSYLPNSGTPTPRSGPQIAGHCTVYGQSLPLFWFLLTSSDPTRKTMTQLTAPTGPISATVPTPRTARRRRDTTT